MARTITIGGQTLNIKDLPKGPNKGVNIKMQLAKFDKQFSSGIAFNVEQATIAFKGRVRIVVSRPGRTGKVKRKNRNVKRGFAVKNRSASVRRGSTGKVLGFEVRSRPGEPPRKQEGTLRSRISHEMDRVRMVGRVGTNYKVAKFLEGGTKFMEPRPFLEPTLHALRPTLTRLMTRTVL